MGIQKKTPSLKQIFFNNKSLLEKRMKKISLFTDKTRQFMFEVMIANDDDRWVF
jgi:hypothetical protein